mmetsp:Transcript_13535/g.24270  ORF Transcript_13535/g.24270 Transcript_13535/m.24270 type:complete len:454 (-) Transcript_13535:97-1458(-)|eukprot:CAMPEP_0182445998 /NCGR_PEP_ID=MMETSP1172-20130603/3918_1 /TAXON_ID=708627 /ORGANISM="Timspurckia oligopyrenoides, Strain CCMP3278" /LENGTH=453 /DNA_ID=CAMNT_0024641853 /DNA_START=619 /DNA_END=1980 /DNA_ORIENTATION=-
MASTRRTELTKQLTAAGMSPETCENYTKLLRNLFSAQMTKIEFEASLRKLLPPDKLRIHNQLIRLIISSALNRKINGVSLPSLLPQKEKRSAAALARKGAQGDRITPAAKAAQLAAANGTVPGGRLSGPAGKKQSGAKRKVSPNADAPDSTTAGKLAKVSATDKSSKKVGPKSRKGSSAAAIPPIPPSPGADRNSQQKYIQQQILQHQAQRKNQQQKAAAAAKALAARDGATPGAFSSPGVLSAAALAGAKKTGSLSASNLAALAQGNIKAESKTKARANSKRARAGAGKDDADLLVRSGAQGKPRAGGVKQQGAAGVGGNLRTGIEQIAYPNMVFAPSMPGAALDLELFLRIRHRMQRVAVTECGMSSVNDDATALVSHAIRLHLKNIIEAGALTRLQRSGNAKYTGLNSLDANGHPKSVSSLDLLLSVSEDRALLGQQASSSLEKLAMLLS